MRKYEMMFIVRPDVPEEDVDKLIAQMQGVVTGSGGKVEKVEKMGRRTLAYRVRKHREGFYVLLTLEGGGDAVKEVERRLKVTDSVIKFLTVRIDEKQKKAEKLKALKAKEDARRPRSRAGTAPGGPAPAAPVAPQSSADAAQA